MQIEWLAGMADAKLLWKWSNISTSNYLLTKDGQRIYTNSKSDKLLFITVFKLV